MAVKCDELTAAYVQPMTARYNGLASYKVRLVGTSEQFVLLRSYVPRALGDRVLLLEQVGPTYSFLADLFVPAVVLFGFAIFAAVAALLFRTGPFS